MKVNKQYFDSASIEAGEMQNFLDVLLKEANSNSKYFNDIHIYPVDGGAFVIEWVQVPYSREWGGSFKFVDEDETIMKEVRFPDDHYDYVFPEEEETVLKEWHEKHPEWILTDYGTWTNIEENRLYYIDSYLKSDLLNEETEFETIKETNFTKELKKDRRLHRTDYIVCNEKTSVLLKSLLSWRSIRLKEYTKEYDDEYTHKAFVVTLLLDKQQFNKEEPVETYEQDFPVYVCKSFKDNEFALCLDNGYKWFYKISLK